MHPITGSEGEEISTSLSTSSPQKAGERSEVTPQDSLLSKLDGQSPQLLFIGLSFQPCHQLCCPPLAASKDLHILLEFWGSELHTELRVRLPQC